MYLNLVQRYLVQKVLYVYNLYHRINSMDNTIGDNNISKDDISLTRGGSNLDTLVSSLSCDLLSSSSSHLTIANLSRQNFCRYNMTQQHLGKSSLVGKQTVQSVGRNLGKGIIGWSQYCERSSSCQSINKISSLDGSHQSRESWITNSNFNNVHCRSGFCSSSAVVTA